MERVSVIMPCYNDGQYIEEALYSLRAQTYLNWELIVIDGIIPEPAEGAHANPAAVFDAVDAALQKALRQADRISDPAAHRHKKFRTMGSAFLQEPGKDLF